MHKSISGFGAAALMALGLAFVGTTADAESLVIAGMGGAAGPGTQSAPAPAPAPVPAPGLAPAPRVAKSKTECNAEYAANKAAIRASGQTKRAFLASCRGGQETFSHGLSGIKQ